MSKNKRQALLISGLAIFACGLAFGQAAENLTFEVASVRPAEPQAPGRFISAGRGGPGSRDPGLINWTNANLKILLTIAYNVKNYQVSGPAWLDTERYDVIAKVPQGATKEQVGVMWRNLLKERFGMVVHHESREFPVSDLVLAKGGPRFKETTLDPNTPPGDAPSGPPKIIKNGSLDMQGGRGILTVLHPGPTGPIAQMVGRAQTMAELAAVLGNQLNKPVMDKTGLPGKYDIQVEYTPDLSLMPFPGAGSEAGRTTSADNASDPGSNLASAIEEQLGLRLMSNKGKLDVVVVDKAEKTPTDN